MSRENPAFPKTRHNFKLLFEDGTNYDMHADGRFSVRSPIDQGADVELLSEDLLEGDGYIDQGEMRSGRSLLARLFFEGYDEEDIQLRGEELSRLFARYEEFWIVRDLQPTKRIKVRRVGAIVPQYDGGKIVVAEVALSSASPYWESIGTTLQLGSNPSTELWGYGSGLNTKNKYNYRLDSNGTHIVHNEGTAPVDGRQEWTPLVITIRGATDRVQITNLRTDESWGYSGSSVDGDVIVLEGSIYEHNGVNIFARTSREAITLLPGRNPLKIIGLRENAIVEIEHRFYYE